MGAVVVVTDRWPNPARLPEPHLLFMTQKTFVTPVRLIQFLALCAVMTQLVPAIAGIPGPLARFLCRLGRQSLIVFCVGSLLSLTGQIVRFAVPGGGLALDIAIACSGILVLSAVARGCEAEAGMRRSQDRLHVHSGVPVLPEG